MADRPVVSLQPDRQRRLQAGHPWAYSNEVQMTAAAKALPAGSLVTLATATGQPLGTALWNPKPLISARLIDRTAGIAVDADYLAAKLQRAVALRDLLFGRPYYRLVHAEADGLPGLVVDRFGDIVVAQLNSAGMAALEGPLMDAIERVLAPRAVVLRNDSPARETEGLETGVAVARGAIEGPIELEENGSRFLADLQAGQKTGWFFDQRDNRAAVAAVAAGRRVLDVFCYAGGFGVQAAVAGAESVSFVDRSKPALAIAMEAAALNCVDGVCGTVAAEGLHHLERLGEAGERFGVVVADPPAFVKSRKDLAAGIRAYRKMTRLAAALVQPGGFLFVASCSHNVEPGAFADEVRAGLARAGRGGRILRSAGAAADHPVHPFLPESAYLKALLLQLD